jgi:Eukaryotic cytochrome b561
MITKFLIVSVVFLIILFVGIPAVGGLGWVVLYGHPICMCLGFLCYGFGVVSYVTDLGPWNKSFPDRKSRRLLHGTIQFIGSSLFIIGYLLVTAFNKVNASENSSYVPTMLDLSHMYLGNIIIGLIVLQMTLGIRKLIILSKEGRVSHVFHSVFLGPLLFTIIVVNMSLGISSIFYEGSNANNFVSGIIAACLILLLVITYLFVVIEVLRGPKNRRLERQSEYLTRSTSSSIGINEDDVALIDGNN